MNNDQLSIEGATEFIRHVSEIVEPLYDGVPPEHGIKYHILDVMHKAYYIGYTNGLSRTDSLLVILGAAYHDIGLKATGRKDHHIRGGELVMSLYKAGHFDVYTEIPITNDRIEILRNMVGYHRSSDTVMHADIGQIDILSKVVADADHVYFHMAEGVIRAATDYIGRPMAIEKLSRIADAWSAHIDEKFKSAGYLKYYLDSTKDIGWDRTEKFTRFDIGRILKATVYADNISFEYSYAMKGDKLIFTKIINVDEDVLRFSTSPHYTVNEILGILG